MSILIITALGVTMLTGLYAATMDLYHSADVFYDDQDLFDLRVLSTMGLTADDVEALASSEGVEYAVGSYSETVFTEVDGLRKRADVTVLSQSYMNVPYLLDGTIPMGEGEIAVTQKYIDESGKRLGDTVSIDEAEGSEPLLPIDISPVADDADGGDPDPAEADTPTFLNTTYVITAIVLDPRDIQSSDSTATFRSNSMNDYVFFVTEADAEYDIYTTIYLRLEDAAELNSFSDVYLDKVHSVTAYLETEVKGEREQARHDSILAEAGTEIANAERDMNTEFEEADQELAAARSELEEARQTLDEAESSLVQEEETLEQTLAAQRAELEAAMAELDSAEERLNEEESRARTELAAAWDEINDAKSELKSGETELADEEEAYERLKSDARQNIAEAKAELANIDVPLWYIQDRNSLDSYSSFDNDLASIETIGRVFPILFLFVAILMSMTTMTRMVEEERSLIGTYKAIGYSDAAINRKYIVFALLASVLGGIIGDGFGFIVLPKFVILILEELYFLPQYYLRFDLLYGIGGILIFVVSVLLSTVLACRNELLQLPARLLRPKAPRAGSRVLLERLKPVWNRLKFLNKVTVRNLFRYKKRLFMTIGGIMGCTALILCGFAINDSVFDLAPKQYGTIYQYDLMVVYEPDEGEALLSSFAEDERFERQINIRVESAKLINEVGEEETAQIFVIPDELSVDDYIRLESIDGLPAQLSDEGVLITQNAGQMLNLEVGDSALIQTLELEQNQRDVSAIVKQYLGNIIYMTPDVYESMFTDYEPNAVLVHLSDDVQDQAAYARSWLDHDAVLSSVSTQESLENFSFDLMSAVMFLIISMAGGLALVVLFTLSNTNISERKRELATIKVLGFYDKEVYQYVNKETFILTAIGVGLGLPVGRIISGFLTTALNLPSIHFAVYVKPLSYLLTAGITFFFAIIVNWVTNRSLNRINMVEALKSVE